MAAASDKARFYLEQSVPELQEFKQKRIFTPEEITAIAAKRRDFEHIVNARGSKPSDWVRYVTHEINVDSLRKKRCRRLGVKGTKHFGGQRTVFFILDRATKKFPGDMGLWMQYIQFCQKEKANKKLAKVFTSVLRLKPREYGLWVLAAKWYAEQQGDVTTARSYMQRGLRFCKDERRLWLEYAKLEMVYLAKLAARRKILGLDEERGPGGGEEAEQMEVEEDENMIALPDVTAEDFEPDAGKGIEQVNEEALKRLKDAPAYTGGIPMAIFDAAMKEFKERLEVAEEFFDLVANFERVPSSAKILQHILEHLQSTAKDSPEAIMCQAKYELFGIDVLSADFPVALGKSLSRIKAGLGSLPEKQQPVLTEKAALLLLPYLERFGELDEDVSTVIVASLTRYLRIFAASGTRAKSAAVRGLANAVKNEGKVSGARILQLWKEIKTQRQ
jgi:U3 small nucleolar RNA-associated protein 6